MCCEYRVMLPKFTIGLNETKLGIVAPTWFQAPMRNIIGARQAELALTTGRMFTTEEALKVGLIDEVATDKNDLMTKAENYLLQFAKISPPARSLTKISFRSQEIKVSLKVCILYVYMGALIHFRHLKKDVTKIFKCFWLLFNNPMFKKV